MNFQFSILKHVFIKPNNHMEIYKKYKNSFKLKVDQCIKNEWASRIKH